MELRRVVVTGMGIVCPLGCGVETAWANMLAGESGARRIDDFDVSDIACQIAFRLPLGDYATRASTMKGSTVRCSLGSSHSSGS